MKKRINILLQQHIGAPDKPVVKTGDLVKRGSLIAIPERLGSNIHASLEREVVEVSATGIIIEAKELQTNTYEKIAGAKSIVEKIKAAGIVGMDGAGFPTHVKMDIDLQGGVVIANVIECEPLLKHNIWQLENACDTIYKGLKYAMQVTNVAKGIFVIK